MTKIQDTTEVRNKRIIAYRNGEYTMSAPPVYTGSWDEEAWCNFVVFNDPEISGFVPYNKLKQVVRQ